MCNKKILAFVFVVFGFTLQGCSPEMANALQNAANNALYIGGAGYPARTILNSGINVWGAAQQQQRNSNNDGSGQQYGNNSQAYASGSQQTNTNGQQVIDNSGWETFLNPALDRLKGAGVKDAKKVIANGVVIALEVPAGQITDDQCWPGHRCVNAVSTWNAPRNRFDAECKSYHQTVTIDGRSWNKESRACRDPSGGYWVQGDGRG